MKAIRVSEGIVPLGAFKAQASRLLKELKQETSPLVITQNGRPAAVVLSPEAYDELQEKQEFLEAVATGLTDAVTGRVIEHEKVAQWLARWGSEDEGEPSQPSADGTAWPAVRNAGACYRQDAVCGALPRAGRDHRTVAGHSQ